MTDLGARRTAPRRRLPPRAHDAHPGHRLAGGSAARHAPPLRERRPHGIRVGAIAVLEREADRAEPARLVHDRRGSDRPPGQRGGAAGPRGRRGRARGWPVRGEVPHRARGVDDEHFLLRIALPTSSSLTRRYAGGRGETQLFAGAEYHVDHVYNVIRDLPASEVGVTIAGTLQKVEVEAGSMVARQGAPADKFVIVLAGRGRGRARGRSRARARHDPGPRRLLRRGRDPSRHSPLGDSEASRRDPADDGPR